jgi:AcrR family transcriptional regulator
MVAKKKRSQKETKQKLLKAALDVFSKMGYDAATTRTIAKKAGVNEALIHRYFESKLGLFLALKKQFRENLISQLLAYEECKTLEEELVQFMKFRLEYVRKGKKFFKLSLSQAILNPKVRDDMKSYATLKPAALLERFEKFKDKGQLRSDVSAEDLTNLLHIFSLALSVLTDTMECLPSTEAEDLITVAARVLSRGVR